jgi:hypothetical protein
MVFHKIIGLLENPRRADKSAMGAIHRHYVLDKSALYCLKPALEAALERYVSTMFHFETDFFQIPFLL